MMSYLLLLPLITMITGHLLPVDVASTQANLTSVEGYGPPGPLEGAKDIRPVERILTSASQDRQTTARQFLAGVGAGGARAPVELHVSLHGAGGAGQGGAYPGFGGNNRATVGRPAPNNPVGYPAPYSPTGYPGQYNPSTTSLAYTPFGYPGAYGRSG